MPIRLSGVETFGKSDTFKFDPRQLVTRFGPFTGRSERTEEQIAAMVRSLLLNGQESAFVYRKGHDGGPIPVDGHTRILAAARITERRLSGPCGGTAEIQFGPDAPFLLRGELRQMNETEACIHSFTANWERNPPNDTDIAFLIRTLNEVHGLNDAEIARRLGQNPGWVAKHRKVLDLDSGTQRQLASGELKLDAAVAAGEVAPAKRVAVVERAKRAGGATAPNIRKAARAEGAAERCPHTDSDFRAWVRSTIEASAAGAPQRFLRTVLDYHKGTAETDDLDKAFEALG
jgi:hypothetical protein